MVEKTQDVMYDELVEITLADGSKRKGKVLEIETDMALVQSDFSEKFRPSRYQKTCSEESSTEEANPLTEAHRL